MYVYYIDPLGLNYGNEEWCGACCCVFQTSVCIRSLLPWHPGCHQGSEPERQFRRGVQDCCLDVGRPRRRAQERKCCIYSILQDCLYKTVIVYAVHITDDTEICHLKSRLSEWHLLIFRMPSRKAATLRFFVIFLRSSKKMLV